MSVEALARVLADCGAETMEGRAEVLRTRLAERILADPGPLLEALAQAGVLEVERTNFTAARDWLRDDQVGPRRRFVSLWVPDA